MAQTGAGRRAHGIIGEAIRRLRERDGLTQQQLAVDAGISYQHLCGIERGHENFSIGMLERIATALDLSLAALVGAAYGEESSIGFARPLANGARALATETDPD